jgi:hypothetical protein
MALSIEVELRRRVGESSLIVSLNWSGPKTNVQPIAPELIGKSTINEAFGSLVFSIFTVELHAL